MSLYSDVHNHPFFQQVDSVVESWGEMHFKKDGLVRAKLVSDGFSKIFGKEPELDFDGFMNEISITENLPEVFLTGDKIDSLRKLIPFVFGFYFNSDGDTVEIEASIDGVTDRDDPDWKPQWNSYALLDSSRNGKEFRALIDITEKRWNQKLRVDRMMETFVLLEDFRGTFNVEPDVFLNSKNDCASVSFNFQEFKLDKAQIELLRTVLLNADTVNFSTAGKNVHFEASVSGIIDQTEVKS